jgi:hypothetical protein
VVWRRIVVRSDTTLPEFASILEATMGWAGYHMHMFEANGICFGQADMDMESIIDEQTITVEQVLPQPKSKLRWDYDFGDGWEHDIIVEAIDSPDDMKRYPYCVAGKQTCPPEDCGGIPGYENLLRVLANPSDPEYKDLFAWTPEGFDPNVFDLSEINEALAGFASK